MFDHNAPRFVCFLGETKYGPLRKHVTCIPPNTLPQRATSVSAAVLDASDLLQNWFELSNSRRFSTEILSARRTSRAKAIVDAPLLVSVFRLFIPSLCPVDEAQPSTRTYMVISMSVGLQDIYFPSARLQFSGALGQCIDRSSCRLLQQAATVMSTSKSVLTSRNLWRRMPTNSHS